LPYSAYQFQTSVINGGIVPIKYPGYTDSPFTISFWYKNLPQTDIAVDVFGNIVNTTGMTNNVRLIAYNISGVLTMRFVRWNGTEFLYGPTLLTINDNAWHFIKIWYEGDVPGNTKVHINVDLGVETVLDNQNGYVNAIFENQFIIGGIGFNIFDLRIFNLQIPVAALTYYYNDVLTGGRKTLPLV
jgi:hypothetical protein